jgi:phage terminase large subunit GpA-like protein
VKGRRQRKCLHCGELFYPDARNAHHQRYCAEPACRRASKAASQRRWLSKPANRDYFRGAANVERVRIWRAEHPGYTRRERSAAAQAPSALQDVCAVQPIESSAESGQLAPSALQEFLTAQPIVLIGLIANLTGSALQEEIAFSARRFQQLGQDILSGRTPPVGGACDAENPVNPIPVPPGPASVQLDRSAPGA